MGAIIDVTVGHLRMVDEAASLIITPEGFPEGDHIVVNATPEGLIIERWSEVDGEYTQQLLTGTYEELTESDDDNEDPLPFDHNRAIDGLDQIEAV